MFHDRLTILCVFLAVVISNVQGQYRFDCDHNFCQRKDKVCPALNCQDGRIVKHATQCGCCDICIKILKEGEKCETTIHGISKIQECGYGLICDKASKLCVLADTKCITEQKAFDTNKNMRSLLEQRPECDYFGHFKPVKCIPGVLCYCVDKDGERIFGTDLSTMNDTMQCDCSQDIKNFPRKVAGGSFPRCLPNGNYDPLQCSDEMCFCVESIDEYDVVNLNSSLKDLSCYDKKIHENRLKPKCWMERDKELAVLKNGSFSEIVGLDLTECDLDGSYLSVQCKKDRCNCVNKNGEPYDGYQMERSSSGRKMKQICDCLRDKDLLKTIDVETESLKEFEKVNCNDIGNYIKY